MLVTLNEILKPCIDRDQAIGSFSTTTYPDAKPVIDAAEKLNAPVIVMVGPWGMKHMDLGLWGKLLVEMANRASVPVCILLDHAKKVDEIQAAIDAGFSSVMIDGSQLPYDENVAITREVVKRASRKGISVEAEIGSVAYSGTDKFKAELSDPDTTARFVEDTKIDAVAIAVGTLHRMEKQAAHINFDLLHSIEERVSIPLVIHGSSGLLDEEFVKMRSTHVCKVNIGTCLRIAFHEALKESLAKDPDNYVFPEILQKPMAAVEEGVIAKLNLLGF